MVSKTIGGQPSCRFDPDLRQYRLVAELCSGSTADFEYPLLASNGKQNPKNGKQNLTVQDPKVVSKTAVLASKSGKQNSKLLNRLLTIDSQLLIQKFLKSRPEGTSKRSLEFYEGYLNRAIKVVGTKVDDDEISDFINSRTCSLGGKHAYYRTLRAFYNWLYSPESKIGLDRMKNPFLFLKPPKVERRIMPVIDEETLSFLENYLPDLRDKTILNVLFYSGMRLSEMVSVTRKSINWKDEIIRIIGKGNKERDVPLSHKCLNLLKEYLNSIPASDGNIWNGRGTVNGMQKFFRTLRSNLKEQYPDTEWDFTPHAFRRGFACYLHKLGISDLDIMRLGGWSSLSMVDRYTSSLKPKESLQVYKKFDKTRMS